MRRVKAEDTTVAGAVGAASLLAIHDMIDHDKAGGRRPHHNLHLQVGRQWARWGAEAL